MSEFLTLCAGAARLVLAPKLGGAIARLDRGERPVLRPWSGDHAMGEFALASNILVPFSNRISGGGFSWNNKRCNIEPNFAGEQFPIHGDGFQKPWRILSHTDETATLLLEKGSIGPFEYRARQDFLLTSSGLRIELKLTNTGPEALPFGCGFHPWFPRDAETKLQFCARGVWIKDKDNLPGEHLSLADYPAWDFGASRPLPAHLVDNPWSDWDGTARIKQGPAFASLELTACDALNCAIVYSHDADCGFFCFEPVSHPVDAHNMAGLPGLEVLAPGQSMSVWMQMEWGAAVANS